MNLVGLNRYLSRSSARPAYARGFGGWAPESAEAFSEGGKPGARVTCSDRRFWPWIPACAGMSGGCSQRRGRFQHRLRMARDFDVFPHLGDAPVAPDQEGGAAHAHELAAVHR